MKNKKGVYLLLVVVLIIWGAVVYRLFFQGKGNDSSNFSNHSFVPEAVDLTSLNDTFSIHSNYRDPFLGNVAPRNSRSGGTGPAKSVAKTPVASVAKWPTIVFHGLIRNQKSNKQVAWVQIDSHSFNMAPGTTQMGVELKRCFKDSILVVFNAEKRTIKK